MRMNTALKKQLSVMTGTGALPRADERAFARGFRREGDCCLLIDWVTNVERSDFQDNTSYECFMNSIHACDFCDGGELHHALGFVRRLFDEWRAFGDTRPLRVIVSNPGDDAVGKWHVVRAGESWLDDNLEGYLLEGVLEIDSSDPWPWGALVSNQR
jgi:hypothetical protein